MTALDGMLIAVDAVTAIYVMYLIAAVILKAQVRKLSPIRISVYVDYMLQPTAIFSVCNRSMVHSVHFELYGMFWT